MAVRMESRQRLHLRGLGVSLVRIAALTVVFVGSAAASSSARWFAPQSVGRSTISFAAVNSGFVPNETQPVVAFDRSGAAGLAFVNGVSTFLAERNAGGRFSSPVLLAQGSGGVVNPFGLAFTSTGETVALLHVFDDLGQGGNECCDQLAGLVRPEHRSAEVQTLGRLAQYPFAGQLGPDPGSGLYSAGVALLPVADGLLAFTGAGQVWELVNGATQFDRLSDLTTSAVGRSVVSVAADGVGGAFATWETSDETGLVTGPVMVYVAYRAPGHSFRPPVRTALGPAGSVVGPDFVSSPLIAAWGRRRADLAWVLDTPTNRSDAIGGSPFGPRLQAAIVTLTARHRVSRRGISELARDLFGVTISTGSADAICQRASEALAGPHLQLQDHVLDQGAVHVDETGWRTRGEGRALWTATTPEAAFFLIAQHCNRAQFNALIGTTYPGIVVADRWNGYAHLDPTQRQVCWSHLQRDFRRHADGLAEQKTFGEQGIPLTNQVFAAWRAYQHEHHNRQRLQGDIAPIQTDLRALLETASPKKARNRWHRQFARNLLKVWPALWTFTTIDGVEPTNNPAERALRGPVIHRKISLGTQSQNGERFAERALSAAVTCRMQHRSLFTYLSELLTAHTRGDPFPALTC